MRKPLFLICLFLLPTLVMSQRELGDGLYAKITTNIGTVLIKLEYRKAPITVANFVGLAEGKIKNSIKPIATPFYNNLLFHRVIEDFMIQGGCPRADGTGGTGYLFDDEFHPDLLHDRPGTIAMANSGPNSNSSQFYITHKPTPWLDKLSTVFGYVIEGMDVVNSITVGDGTKKIEIIRIGKEAKKFDAAEIFRTKKFPIYEEGIYVEIITTKGTIYGKLDYDKAPVTTANFILLAEGNQKNTFRDLGEPFFDSLTFHRVVPNFMIQGGDPKGDGTGDPGYKFKDEFHPFLKHNKPGIFSMANSGSNKNNCQFFITHTQTPWLDYKHSIFGKVVYGMSVVDNIEKGDIMLFVKIIRKGKAANKFNPLAVFEQRKK